ncbi:hypothetical protein Tco_0875574 [Tanacetum coccineum]|uniref:Uncharacterized protein n=1 Tax=Tanacetum coccineum TaxID=301880 RepID=A0ABQ5BQR2_9ASTR
MTRMDQLSVEQGWGTIEQNPTTVEETHALYDSLYNNLAIEVEKETNAELSTELARYKDKKSINALHLSSAKTITTLNEEIANLNNQLSKEKSTVSSLQEEKKKVEKMALGYQNPFYLKQAQQKQQSLYIGKVLLEKHEPLAVYDSEETLQLAQEKAAKFVLDFRSLANEADESLAKHKALEFEIECLLKAVVSQDIMSIVQNNSVVDTSNLQTEFDQCKYDKISYDKAYNDMQQKIERLQAQLEDLKGKPPSSSRSKLYSVTPFPKSKGLLKIDESHALSKPVTSNSTSREEKSVPNKPIKASVRTKPITVSQPHVITKKHVNSDSNGLSSTGVDNTAKTRRPQPRSNTKNDRVPSASKSSCIKNKEVEVEEHHRNLLLSKNKKHMSSECNNFKLVIRNDKSFLYVLCVSNV